MKVAIVHYWWLSNRGGEAVCKAIVELYPQADLYLHVCDEEVVRNFLPKNFTGKIRTTFISKLPGAKKHYQKYLPLMPLALEQLDLSEYDLVLSSESGPAKGIVTRPDALHVCYCHSPMRYIWDMYHEYLVKANIIIRKIFPLFAHYLRMWDRLSADRVDFFIANSSFVASRINKYYRREAEVLFPPVNVYDFDHKANRGDFYLCLGQLVRYKKADLAVDVFNELGLPLKVVGEGELFDELKSRAKNNVEIMGRQPFSTIKELLQSCKGLVFPGMEDFGIVPVEAMASGAPVIAYAKGGALETVIDGETGIYFYEQTVESLSAAIMKLESGEISFRVDTLRLHAEQFNQNRFKEQLKLLIEEKLISQ